MSVVSGQLQGLIQYIVVYPLIPVAVNILSHKPILVPHFYLHDVVFVNLFLS